MRDLSISSLIACFVFLSSCSIDDNSSIQYITGTGPVVSIPVSVDSFTSIQHSSIGNMAVTVGDTFSVVFKAQENVLSEMIYEEEEGVFFWGLKNNVQLLEYDTILAEITLPEAVKNIQLLGFGNIYINGPGQPEINLYLQGSGNIMAYGIETEKAAVFHTGVGHVEVHVTEELTGEFSGTGNIYYKGSPSINLPITGSGELIDDN